MIKDNSAYLIKEIKQATQKKIGALKLEHKDQLKALKAKHDKSADLKQLESSLAKQREAFVKQQENMIALKIDHAKLAALGELVKQVTEEVKQELLKPAMVKAIIESLGDVKDVQVPKTVKITGTKTRDDNKIVGTLKSGAQVEFDVDEFLVEQKGVIYQRVREAL